MDEENNQTHDIVASVDDPQAEDILNLIPKRMKHNLKHLAKTPIAINCTVCSIILPLNINDVVHHLSLQSHISRSGTLKYFYYCDICYTKTNKEDLWQKHLDSKDHAATYEKLGASRKNNCKEYQCLTCTSVLFGDRLSINRHEIESTTKKNRNQVHGKVALKPDAMKLLQSRQRCDAILAQLIKESDKTLNNDTALKECLKAFEDCLVKTYPNYKAYPFGSRSTGLGTLKSDLDIFIDIGDMYNGSPEFNSIKQQAVIRKIKTLLTGQEDIFNDIYPLNSARTPILKVMHVPTKVDCDLSFRSGLSVENTKFIKFCMNLQPAFRPVMILLKKWGELVNTKPEICSYALCMLMIFFMQRKRYLISVHTLRQLTDPNAPLVDNWNIITYNKTYSELQDHIKLDNKVDAYSTLKQFFDYYKDFKFKELVVCPLLGDTVPVYKFNKTDFGKDLPKEMHRYQVNIAEDPECQFRVMASMFVQDPFDLGHNLTKAVPPHFVNSLQQLFALSSKQMRL